MLCNVTIDPDGAVSVTIEDDNEPADEDTRRLVGLTLDDLLARAADKAASTWLGLRTHDDEEPANSGA